MALTAAMYLYTKALPNAAARSHFAASIWKLNLQHPAVPSQQDPQQVIRVTASKTVDITRMFDLSFALEKQDCSSQKLGDCQIYIDDTAEWTSEWNRMSYFISSRINAIIESAKSGRDGSHWLRGSVVYRLFANLVTYDERYQGIQDAFITHDFSEGAATVRLRSKSPADQFTLSPYCIDTLMHLSGFLLNGNPMASPELAYIASGFERLRICMERLEPEEIYTTYVRLRPMSPSLESKFSSSRVVDVFIFKGDEQIGVCDGINYQVLPKSVFGHILGKANSHQTDTQDQERMAHNEGRNPIERPSSHDDKVFQPLFEQTSERSTQANTPTPTSSSSTSLPETRRHPANLDIIEIFISKVLSETHMDREHLTEITAFADLGVDALLSIAILKEIKLKTGLELEASFFISHPTLADARRALAKITGQSDAGHLPMEVACPLSRKYSEEMNGISLPFKATRKFTSNVILVQGTSSPGKTPLFLISDGTGSAASYVNLPRFPTHIQVFALESPFLHRPMDFTCSVSQVAAMYLEAIHTIQSHGPYMLGGWSAGAVYAYEVARLLLESGEKILGLLLIDMRGPRYVKNCQEPTMEILNRVGLLTGIDRTFTADTATTTGMKEHLLATVKCLSKFNPIAMDVRRRPEKTVLIWATEQLQVYGSEGGSPDIPWFYPSSHAFDADGWDELVGQAECRLLATDHFLMMTPPAVSWEMMLFRM
jgi:iterative type I PKS product template protein